MEEAIDLAEIIAAIAMSFCVFRLLGIWRVYLDRQRAEEEQQAAATPNDLDDCHPDGGSDSGIMLYPSRNSRAYYRFNIEHMSDDTYRIYILHHPSYGNRDTSQHVTHRLSDSQGDYVCWTGRPTVGFHDLWTPLFQKHSPPGPTTRMSVFSLP